MNAVKTLARIRLAKLELSIYQPVAVCCIVFPYFSVRIWQPGMWRHSLMKIIPYMQLASAVAGPLEL